MSELRRRRKATDMPLVRTKHGRCEWAQEDDYIHIYNLFVAPEYRRQGHAESILRKAIKQIRDSGHETEILIVTEKDYLARFYARLGLKDEMTRIMTIKAPECCGLCPMYWDYDDEIGECLRYGKTVKVEERYQICIDSDIELEEK